MFECKTLFAAIAAVTCLGAAQASTVVASHVMNPASVAPCCFVSETLATPFTLQVGDTLDQTVTFTGDALVSINHEDAIWFLNLTGPSQTMQVSGTIEFLNPSANLMTGPIALPTQTNSFIHVGFYVPESAYRLGAGAISFSGVRQILTIDSSDSLEPRTYDQVVLNYFTSAVPEPTSWALMLGGLGLVGWAGRRRSAA